ncbi:IS3 family transposase [Pseudoduganella sp. GCM10020061]|uniref:IS3 family transposase n=1 Tax=Pseudoduganella sp. GCM10020061 TaxID=3317345 RepID=UPI00363A9214
MSKYSEQVKLAVIDLYLSGAAGYKAAGKQYGVCHTMVREWVTAFRHHGVEGLRAKLRQVYSAEFKLKALQHMWDHKLTYTEAAGVFDVRNHGVLSAWERSYHAGGIDALAPKKTLRPQKNPVPTSKKCPENPVPRSAADDVTREQLIDEVNYLRMEVAYLKKLKALSSGRSESAAWKTQIVQELRQVFPLAGLLKLASLSRSTFYYQVNAMQADDKLAVLKQSISAAFHHHKGRYGYRRVTAMLRQKGTQVNHKTVQRLMQEMGLRSLVRPKKYQSYRGDVGHAAPNVLERNFHAEHQNEKWTTDVTEFKIGGNKLYLSPVMDLYNGEIIAYEISKRPKYELVGAMLSAALMRLPEEHNLIFHSDQGWQYRMSAYQNMLCERNITQSMSRKGNCLDNAAMESFFAVLKTEYFYMNKFDDVDQLSAGLAEYIDYYNNQRIKTRLNGMSPVQYRTHAQMQMH